MVAGIAVRYLEALGYWVARSSRAMTMLRGQ
jgi:hypothetical protein